MKKIGICRSVLMIMIMMTTRAMVVAAEDVKNKYKITKAGRMQMPP
jgi:hypothetical protein